MIGTVKKKQKQKQHNHIAENYDLPQTQTVLFVGQLILQFISAA